MRPEPVLSLLLRGLDVLLVDMVRDPPAAHAAVDFAVALCCEHIRLSRDARADFIFTAAASDGLTAIRPKHSLDYTIPGLVRIVNAARRRSLAHCGEREYVAQDRPNLRRLSVLSHMRTRLRAAFCIIRRALPRGA